MKKVQFYQCKGCKTILLEVSGAAAQCCNEELVLLPANEVEASLEKHIPVVEFKDGKLTVKVGSLAHPMLPEHYIEWIFIQTTKGGQYAHLAPQDAPEAVFTLEKCDVVGVYAYCNLHGLWTANIASE